MPFKSDAQRRYFNANRKQLEAEGVDVDEWNESSKGKKLPEKVAFSPASKLVDMKSSGGVLADYLTPGSWGGERAGRTQAMADAMGEKTTFGVRHPATQTAVRTLGGAAGGAAAGGGLGLLLAQMLALGPLTRRATGSARFMRGMQKALTHPLGGIGASVGGLAGAAGGDYSAGSARRSEMQRINQLFDQKSRTGGIHPKTPDLSALSAVFLPGRGAHRTGQMEAVKAMQGGPPISQQHDVMRDMLYAIRMGDPVVPALHGWGQNFKTQLDKSRMNASGLGKESAAKEDSQKKKTKSPEKSPDSPASKIVNMESSGGQLADSFAPGSWGGERAGRTQAMADALGEKTTFGVRHPATQAIGYGLGGIGLGATAGGGLGHLLGKLSRNPSQASPLLATLGALAGGAVGMSGSGYLAYNNRRNEMQRINQLYDQASPEQIQPKDPKFSLLSALLLPGRGPHRTGQAEAVKAMRGEDSIDRQHGVGRDLLYGTANAPYGYLVGIPHGYAQNIKTQWGKNAMESVKPNATGGDSPQSSGSSGGGSKLLRTLGGSAIGGLGGSALGLILGRLIGSRIKPIPSIGGTQAMIHPERWQRLMKRVNMAVGGTMGGVAGGTAGGIAGGAYGGLTTPNAPKQASVIELVARVSAIREKKARDLARKPVSRRVR